MNLIKIYCDGACSGNPGPGGWGACIIVGSEVIQIHGAALETTNNQMELMGAIKGLEYLKSRSIVEVFTDSKYVQMGISSWINNWLKNDWRTSKNQSVKNADLWRTLLDLKDFHQVSWHWVKGHASDKYNIIADKLATKGRDEALSVRQLQY